MEKQTIIGLMLTTVVSFFAPTYSYADDDPLLALFQIDELHSSFGKTQATTLDADFWLGKDLHKFWLKAEGQYANSDEKMLELQTLYSRAISAFWDVQFGARFDIEPASREWLAIGLQGLAPYYFDAEITLFVGKNEQSALRVDIERDFLITQKLILSPEFEFNLYGKNDSDLGVGAGFSDMAIALQLRYEIKREIAPYIGIEWQKHFGNTAKYINAKGDEVSALTFIVGLNAWF
jgi:copper resistance protein B